MSIDNTAYAVRPILPWWFSHWWGTSLSIIRVSGIALLGLHTLPFLYQSCHFQGKDKKKKTWGTTPGLMQPEDPPLLGDPSSSRGKREGGGVGSTSKQRRVRNLLLPKASPWRIILIILASMQKSQQLKSFPLRRRRRRHDPKGRWLIDSPTLRSFLRACNGCISLRRCTNFWL